MHNRAAASRVFKLYTVCIGVLERRAQFNVGNTASRIGMSVFFRKRPLDGQPMVLAYLAQ